MEATIWTYINDIELLYTNLKFSCIALYGIFDNHIEETDCVNWLILMKDNQI